MRSSAMSHTMAPPRQSRNTCLRAVKARRRRQVLAGRTHSTVLDADRARSAVVLMPVLAVAATWPGFDPGEIAVSGNHRVTRGRNPGRAPRVAPNVSIWFQNIGAIASRIEAIPYIATVYVHRALPASIRIVVVERVPFAVLRSGASPRSSIAVCACSSRQSAPIRSPSSMSNLDRIFAPGEYVRDAPCASSCAIATRRSPLADRCARARLRPLWRPGRHDARRSALASRRR